MVTTVTAQFRYMKEIVLDTPEGGAMHALHDADHRDAAGLLVTVRKVASVTALLLSYSTVGKPICYF